MYRVARAKYANLSGVGAARYPGRWNRPGQEAIYTSTEKGVAILETLAHLPKDLIPSNLVIMTISVSGKWVDMENGLLDPVTRGCFWRYDSVDEAKSDFDSLPPLFGGGLNPLAVAVPSVIVPMLNVVLYPQGVGFWNHVKLEDIQPYELDPRLFPESTPTDPLTWRAVVAHARGFMERAKNHRCRVSPHTMPRREALRNPLSNFLQGVSIRSVPGLTRPGS